MKCTHNSEESNHLILQQMLHAADIASYKHITYPVNLRKLGEILLNWRKLKVSFNVLFLF